MNRRGSTSLVRMLISALLCIPTFSFACLWLNGTTLDGLPHQYTPSTASLFKQLMKETPETRLELLRSRLSSGGDESSAEERQAIEAILSDNSRTAIALLLQAEENAPGKYSTAANLGTAYELAGDNEKALRWITEGIARNKDSHEGTEWLHQRILQTKVLLATDPKYLTSHRIIPLPERFEAETLVEVGGTERSIKQIAQAIHYQLRERIVFVKPPDPIVADLLFTYAEIIAHTVVVESALSLLELSQQYGFADAPHLQETIRRYRSIIFLGRIYKYTAITLVVSAFFGGLYYLFRTKRFFLTRAAYLRHRQSLINPGK